MTGAAVVVNIETRLRMVIAQQIRILVKDHAKVTRAAGYPNGIVGRLESRARLTGLINCSLIFNI